MICTFYPRKPKGQAVADFLAEHPDPRAAKLYEDLPDEVAEVCLTETSFDGKCGNFSSMEHQEQAQRDTQ